MGQGHGCSAIGPPHRATKRQLTLDATDPYWNLVTPGKAQGYRPSGPGLTGGSASKA